MFEPMRARFASSCSRNGIKDAATETICFGLTSMKSILSGPDKVNSFCVRQEMRSSTNSPFSFKVAFACAITYWPSSMADR